MRKLYPLVTIACIALGPTAATAERAGRDAVVGKTFERRYPILTDERRNGGAHTDRDWSSPEFIRENADLRRRQATTNLARFEQRAVPTTFRGRVKWVAQKLRLQREAHYFAASDQVAQTELRALYPDLPERLTAEDMDRLRHLDNADLLAAWKAGASVYGRYRDPGKLESLATGLDTTLREIKRAGGVKQYFDQKLDRAKEAFAVWAVILLYALPRH